MVKSILSSRIRMMPSALIIVALLTLALRVAPALAHATFVHGTPGSGDTVCAPTLVSDYFAQHIQVSSANPTYSLWVADANGNQVDNNDNAVDPADTTHMTVSLPPNLAPGVYKVNWATLSDDDGDQASGSYTFTVKAC